MKVASKFRLNYELIELICLEEYCIRAKKVWKEVELFLLAVLEETKYKKVILKQTILQLQVLGGHPYTFNQKNHKNKKCDFKWIRMLCFLYFFNTHFYLNPSIFSLF